MAVKGLVMALKDLQYHSSHHLVVLLMLLMLLLSPLLLSLDAWNAILPRKVRWL